MGSVTRGKCDECRKPCCKLVRVRLTPRKAANPTTDAASGMTPGSRQRRYGSDQGRPEAVPTRRSARCCHRASAAVINMPSVTDAKMAAPMWRWTASVSPLACAAATSGVVIGGMKEVSQKAEEKT